MIVSITEMIVSAMDTTADVTNTTIQVIQMVVSTTATIVEIAWETVSSPLTILPDAPISLFGAKMTVSALKTIMKLPFMIASAIEKTIAGY